MNFHLWGNKSSKEKYTFFIIWYVIIQITLVISGFKNNKIHIICHRVHKVNFIFLWNMERVISLNQWVLINILQSLSRCFTSFQISCNSHMYSFLFFLPVFHICISHLYFPLAFLTCISRLYFTRVVHTCISRRYFAPVFHTCILHV